MKNLLFGFLIACLVLPSLVFFPVMAEEEAMVACTMDYTPVCGVDNETYSNVCMAEAEGIEVSYDFECIDPKSEFGLYEDTDDFYTAGMLVEVGSTDVPTTLIVRSNKGDGDYTVEVTGSTVLGQYWDQQSRLSDWIPGDQIKVIGKRNENTETITASMLINISIVLKTNLGANGWITAINKEEKKITYIWGKDEFSFYYDDDTRFVSGLKNPASADDLEINDRIRARLIKQRDDDPYAKIVVVLRRGEELYMKIRTFRPNATLIRLDSTVVPTTIQVKIENTPGLKEGDVNNLIGTEGALVTVNITENTKLVRKYFGRTTLDEFSIGDGLMIVGRVNDDGTIDAKLIKNKNIWKTSTNGHAGFVTEVNPGEGFLLVDWTPLRYLTEMKLKEKLDQVDNVVTAQTAEAEVVEEELVEEEPIKERKTKIVVEIIKKYGVRFKNRFIEIKNKVVGKIGRIVKHKKVKIERIRHSGVKLKDLIERMPAQNIRVEVTEETVVVIGTNSSAGLGDIETGDRVRIRGVRSSDDPIIITAETIVVVSTLPEIEVDIETDLDEINEVVTIIDTDNDDNEIVNDTVTDTEEEVEGEAATIEEEIETEVEIPPDCTEDSDCAIYWTGYSEMSSCSGCSWGEEQYVCKSKSEGELEYNNFVSLGYVGLCAPCASPDYSYTCSCVNEKCEKVSL